MLQEGLGHRFDLAAHEGADGGGAGEDGPYGVLVAGGQPGGGLTLVVQPVVCGVRSGWAWFVTGGEVAAQAVGTPAPK